MKKKQLLRSALAFALVVGFAGCGGGGGNDSSGDPITGVLDTGFNTTGIVTDNNAAGGNGRDDGYAITVANNKIYVAGASRNSLSDDMAVWSYNLNGSLNTAFNTTGIVIDNNASGGNSYDRGYAITVANDKIYVAGYSASASNANDMAIWSYDLNGSLNTAFNTTGIATHNAATGGTLNDFGRAIAIANDKIYVAGDSEIASNDYDMALWSYDLNGSLNTAFNTTGFLTDNNASGGSGSDHGKAIAIANDKIYVAGYSAGASHGTDMALWSYDLNGTLNTAFNTTGIVIDNGNYPNYGQAITVANNKIYVAGYSNNGSDNDMVVWKYDLDGTLDTSFGGGDGIATWDSGFYDYAYSIQVDADENIIVSGNSNDKATIVMFDATGNVAQSTFATTGYYQESEYSDAYGSIFNADRSRLYVSGSKYNGSNSDMAIWSFK